MTEPGDTVEQPFKGKRQRYYGAIGSIRYDITPGVYLTVFDDGRVKCVMDETGSGRKVKHKNSDRHNYPEGAKCIELGDLLT